MSNTNVATMWANARIPSDLKESVANFITRRRQLSKKYPHKSVASFVSAAVNEKLEAEKSA